MIFTTKALVLRIVPFSETSQVVTWLTPEHGKIVTMIKGALRRNSDFCGQYDLFCLSELLFYPRWDSGLHIARECYMLNPRTYLRRNWKSAACASYFVDLMASWLPLHTPHPEGFQLLSTALDALDGPAPASALLPWFELRMLEMGGVGPGLRACRMCRAPRPFARADECFFSPSKGGVLCPACRSAHAPADSIRPALDVLSILVFLQDAVTWDVARRMRSTPRQELVVLQLLGTFLSRHLEVSDRSRRIMLEVTSLPDGVSPPS